MLYTFYGDDFTGSTDVLEQLASNGIRTVLFLRPPTASDLDAFPDVEAIGIAGDSRSQSPEWMDANLPGIFARLAQFQAPITHYKVCSTFDSSPAHGSIGRAIELGMAALQPAFVPIVVGATHLRRYVAFGHLFAAAPDGQVLRIDRHPMAHHPVTPMRESDLRLHLRAQTALPVGLVPFTALESVDGAGEALKTQRTAGGSVILFDTVSSETQATVGHLLWSEAQRRPLFTASSSGLTAALISAWGRNSSPVPASIESAKPLLVLSGSCSAATERQIRWALAHGFAGIRVDAEDLLTRATLDAVTATVDAGIDTVVYTSLGLPDGAVHGESLGAAFGRLLRQVLERIPVRRVLLCGGDTSSHAVQQLGLSALTWLGHIQPGAPLCLTHSDGPGAHLELVLKGGQVGTEDFFGCVRQPTSVS